MSNLEQKIIRTFLGLTTAVVTNCGPDPKIPDLPSNPDYECIFNYDCDSDETCVNGKCTPLYSTSASKPDIYSAKKDVTENSACPTKYFEDKDGDGYGDYKAWTCDSTLGIDDNSDCNDYDSLVHPGASDYCGGDGIDNNCNGKVDEEGISHYQKSCSNGDVYWFDSCGSAEDILESCSSNYVCEDGECVCKPNCAGKECGNDGCGGSCGNCTSPEKCDLEQLCECVPNCQNKECGNDGCWGDCGTCLENYECSNLGKCQMMDLVCGNLVFEYNFGKDSMSLIESNSELYTGKQIVGGYCLEGDVVLVPSLGAYIKIDVPVSTNADIVKIEYTEGMGGMILYTIDGLTANDDKDSGVFMGEKAYGLCSNYNHQIVELHFSSQKEDSTGPYILPFSILNDSSLELTFKTWYWAAGEIWNITPGWDNKGCMFCDCITSNCISNTIDGTCMCHAIDYLKVESCHYQ